MANHLDRMHKLEACLRELSRCVDSIDSSSAFITLSTANLRAIGLTVLRGSWALSTIAKSIVREYSVRLDQELFSLSAASRSVSSQVAPEDTKE